MTTSPATQATPDAARARRGMWATLLLAVAFLAFSFFTVPEVVTAADWRDRVANSIPPALGLLALVSAGLIWRGRVNLGAWLLLISLWAGFSVVPALVGGYGLVTGVLAVLVPAAIATLALPPRQVGRVILIGVLAAYLMLFVDAYYPGQRMASDADDRAAAQWITLAVLVIYGLVMARQFPSFSLRSKLIIGAVAVSIVSIIAVTLVSIQASRANVFDAAGAGLKNLATSRARALGDLLVNQVEALEALGLGRTLRDRVESISDSYTGDPVAREALLLDLDARWRAAGDDDQLIASRLSNDTAVQLREYSRTFPDHVEVFVTDKYGGLVAASGRTSDYYQADEHWWLAAYNDGAGATFIGQPEYDASAGAFAVNIALPVRDRDTTDIVGVLRTTFAMRALNALMSDIAGGQADIDLYLSVNDRLETESGTIVANDLAPEQLAQALQTTYILAVTEGEASLVASAPIEASGGAAYVRNLGWRAVARLPEAPATAGLETQVNNAILLGAVIAGLAALGAFLVSLSLAGPIQALSAAAEKFAAGDLSARAIVRTRDELGALAATVNTMAGQLHTTLGGLEARVAERTRDLALAADVGRSLSQVQDLDSLLTNAVELIRDRFELYYTQVYLADPTGQTLVLRAGTGDAGEELLRRQHRLPIGPGSLNGRAVAERQTIIVADTRTDPNFRPNLLLPHTRSEKSVPLLVGVRAVGGLDLQSARPGAFTPDNLAAFETLGGQVAIAIQNANLFAEAVQARAEIEAQTKRLVQSGWEDFLNAVERKERLTHTFVGPEPAASRESAELRPLSAPIMVSNQAIGQLTLEADRPWTEDEAGVVQLVARQVAQQVENLRLLARPAGRRPRPWRPPAG